MATTNTLVSFRITQLEEEFMKYLCSALHKPRVSIYREAVEAMFPMVWKEFVIRSIEKNDIGDFHARRGRGRPKGSKNKAKDLEGNQNLE